MNLILHEKCQLLRIFYFKFDFFKVACMFKYFNSLCINCYTDLFRDDLVKTFDVKINSSGANIKMCQFVVTIQKICRAYSH